ncbi:unnamed protein product, partial [Rotaria magnacalcarata]
YDQATIFILFVDDATFKVFLAEFDKRDYWLSKLRPKKKYSSMIDLIEMKKKNFIFLSKFYLPNLQ